MGYIFFEINIKVIYKIIYILCFNGDGYLLIIKNIFFWLLYLDFLLFFELVIIF